MALGSCGHRITHQLRPINMNRRSILSETSILRPAGSDVLLDTSGLLCCLDASESRHQAAVTFFEAEPLKITHNYVLVEFVASAHARRYPRHIALSFVADLATQPNIDVVWVIIRFSQNLHNSLRVSDYARKTLVP
jgi:hypothetical protein